MTKGTVRHIYYLLMIVLSFIAPFYCLANGDGGVVAAPSVTQHQPVEIPKLPALPPLPPPLPVLDHVTLGALESVTHDRTMTLTQTTPIVMADYKSFNIAEGYGVDLHQPSSDALAVFRVNKTSGLSIIDGRFNATGNVLLLNPNGLLIGEMGVIDMNSFIATTHSNFRTGTDAHGRPFLQLDGTENPYASITNRGTIMVGDSGASVFASPITRNYGTISGRAAFVAGEKTTITFDGSDIVQFEVSGKLERAIIEQKGKVVAEGKEVFLSTSATEDFLDTHMINMDGVIVGSKITIDGGDNSQVMVGLGAHLNANGQKGGEIRVLGDDITLKSGALLEASGKEGGGRILVGGAREGQGPEKNAQTLMVEDGVHMTANSWNSGNAGEIINYANHKAILWGIASASALGETGNGGFIEYSGKTFLDFAMDLDHMPKLSSQHGKSGMFLLDPDQVNIDNSNTEWSPTATTVGAQWIATILNDLTITANSIVIYNDITISSPYTLTFNANGIVPLTSLIISGNFTAITPATSNYNYGIMVNQINSSATLTLRGPNITLDVASIHGNLIVDASTNLNFGKPLAFVGGTSNITAPNSITFISPTAGSPNIIGFNNANVTFIGTFGAGFTNEIIINNPGGTVNLDYRALAKIATPIAFTGGSNITISNEPEGGGTHSFMWGSPTSVTMTSTQDSMSIDSVSASIIQRLLYQGNNVTITANANITIESDIIVNTYATTVYPSLIFQAPVTINILANITNIQGYGVGGDIRFQSSNIHSASVTPFTISGLYIHFIEPTGTGTINLGNITPQAIFELHFMGTQSGNNYTSLVTPPSGGVPSTLYSISTNTYFDTVRLLTNDIALTRGSGLNMTRSYFRNVQSNVNILINVNNPGQGDTWPLPIYGYGAASYAANGSASISGIGTLTFLPEKTLNITGTSTQPIALYNLNIVNPNTTTMTYAQIGGNPENTGPTSVSINANLPSGTLNITGSTFNQQTYTSQSTLTIGGLAITSSQDTAIYAGNLTIQTLFTSQQNITYNGTSSVTLSNSTGTSLQVGVIPTITIQSPQINLNGTLTGYGIMNLSNINASPTIITATAGNLINNGGPATLNASQITGTFTATSPNGGTIILKNGATGIPQLGLTNTDTISINAGGGNLTIPTSATPNILGGLGTITLGGTIGTAANAGSLIISNPGGITNLHLTTAQPVILKDSNYINPTIVTSGPISISSYNGSLTTPNFSCTQISFSAPNTPNTGAAKYFTVTGQEIFNTSVGSFLQVAGYDDTSKLILFNNMILGGNMTFTGFASMTGVTLNPSNTSTFQNILVDNQGSAGTLTINNFDTIFASITSVTSGATPGALTLNYSNGITAFNLSKIGSVSPLSTITVGATVAGPGPASPTLITPPNVTGAITVLPQVTTGTLTVSGFTATTDLALNYPGSTILLSGAAPLTLHSLTLNPTPHIGTTFSVPDTTTLTITNGLNLSGVTTSFGGSATIKASSTNLGPTRFTAGGSIVFKTSGAFSWAQDNVNSANISALTVTGYDVGGNLDTTVGAGSISMTSAGGILNTTNVTALSAGGLTTNMPIQAYAGGNTGTFSLKTTGSGPFNVTGGLGGTLAANQPQTISLAPHISSNTDNFQTTAYASTSISMQYATAGTANSMTLGVFTAPTVTIAAQNNPLTFGAFGSQGTPLTTLTVSGTGNLTFNNIYATTIGITGGSSSTIAFPGTIQTNALTVNTSGTLTPTISVTGTIDGLAANSATVNLYGSSLSITNNLGRTNTLQSLTTNVSGNLAITNADIITTTGGISLTAGGSITTTSANGLNILQTTTGPLNFSPGTALTIGHILDVSNLTLNNLSIPLILSGSQLGKLNAASRGTLSITGGTNNIRLGSTNTYFNTINLGTTGNVTFQGPPTGNGAYSPVSTTASTINITTGGAQSTVFVDTNASILTTALNINYAGGVGVGPYSAININGSINNIVGTSAVLNMYGSTISMTGRFGQTTALGSLRVNATTSLGITNASMAITNPTTFNAPTITMGGTNTFTGQYAFTSTGSTSIGGTINATTPLTFSAATFSLTGATTMSGAPSVTINGGNITIGNNLTTTGDLSLIAATALTIGANITAYDGVNYHNITLTGGTSPSQLQGIISASTLSLNGSNFSLTGTTALNAPTMTFNGIHITGISPGSSVPAPTGPWPSLTINAPNTDFTNLSTLRNILLGTFNNITVTGNDITIDNTPPTFFMKGVMALTGNNTYISGPQNGLVSINSTGNISFQDPLVRINPGLGGVTITTTGGVVSFSGNVIANSPLTINASGTITFGGTVTSIGTSALNFTSTGGNVIFNGAVATSAGLTVSSGNITFNGTLGTSLSPLQGALSLTATGNITLTQDVYAASPIALNAASVILGGAGIARIITTPSLTTNPDLYFDVANGITALILNTSNAINLSCFKSGGVQTVTSINGFLLSGNVNAAAHTTGLTLNGTLTAQNVPSLSLNVPLTINGIISSAGQNLTLTTPTLTVGGSITANTLNLTATQIFLSSNTTIISSSPLALPLVDSVGATPYSLTVTAPTLSFNNNVGNTYALSILSARATTGAITLTAGRSFNITGNRTLTAATTITNLASGHLSGGGITTLIAPGAVILPTVGLNTVIGALDASGISGGLTLTGDIASQGLVSLPVNTNFGAGRTISSGNQGIIIASLTLTGTGVLTLNGPVTFPQTTTIPNTLTRISFTSPTISVRGNLTVNTPMTTTSPTTMSISGNLLMTAPLTIGDTTIINTTGNFNIGTIVGNNNQLTLTGNTAGNALPTNFGNLNKLTISVPDVLDLATLITRTGGAGVAALDLTGSSITARNQGGQPFTTTGLWLRSPVILSGGNIVFEQNNGPIEFDSSISWSGQAHDLSIIQTQGQPITLALPFSNNPSTNIVINSAGMTTLSGTINTPGNITIQGPTTITGNTVLTGNIINTGTITGSGSLTIEDATSFTSGAINVGSFTRHLHSITDITAPITAGTVKLWVPSTNFTSTSKVTASTLWLIPITGGQGFSIEAAAGDSPVPFNFKVDSLINPNLFSIGSALKIGDPNNLEQVYLKGFMNINKSIYLYGNIIVYGEGFLVGENGQLIYTFGKMTQSPQQRDLISTINDYVAQNSPSPVANIVRRMAQMPVEESPMEIIPDLSEIRPNTADVHVKGGSVSIKKVTASKDEGEDDEDEDE